MTDVTGQTGVDACDVLTEYLDELSATSAIAAAAPRGPALYGFLATGEARPLLLAIGKAPQPSSC
jgi:hypothetical protein